MICSNYPPHMGGLEIMVQNLVKGLARRHEVTVLTPAFGGNAGVSNEDGVRIHRLPTIHRTEAWGVPYPIPVGPGVRSALGAMRSADLVHTHGALYLTSLLAVRLARRIRRPLVLTEHVGFVRYESAAINRVEDVAWRTIGDHVVRASAAITTYNSRVRSWLESRYPRHPVHFIGNGVDTSAFRPRTDAERLEARRTLGLPAEERLLLFAARNSEKKNLDAVLRIPRCGFRLVVCGAPRQLNEEGVTDLGVVPYREMPALFASVDAMVHASTGEGFPLAVQEALASGLPLVLLWDPGYAESLDPRVVATCSSLAELGDRVRAVLADPALRSALSMSERRWAEERWSWQVTTESYERLYENVVDARG